MRGTRPSPLTASLGKRISWDGQLKLAHAATKEKLDREVKMLARRSSDQDGDTGRIAELHRELFDLESRPIFEGRIRTFSAILHFIESKPTVDEWKLSKALTDWPTTDYLRKRDGSESYVADSPTALADLVYAATATVSTPDNASRRIK